MLKRLKVKNYALIEELDITFGKNLNIFTGQTGAGKSIIIGSINLIIGDKASLEMIRTGEEEGFVEAFFDLNIKFFHNYPQILICHLLLDMYHSELQ